MENRLLRDVDAAKLNPVDLRKEIADKEKQVWDSLGAAAKERFEEQAKGVLTGLCDL